MTTLLESGEAPLRAPLPGLRATPPPARRWRGRVAALLGVAIALWIEPGNVFVIPVLFCLIVPFEKLFPRHRGQRVRRPLVGLDMRYALVSPLLNIAAVGVGAVIAVVSLAWIPGLLLRPVVGWLPAAATPLLGIALFDLAIYWGHRWSHEVPALWRFHAVHHSTEQLDWISGFRVHPLDGIIIAPAFVLLLAAGFSAEFTGVLAVVQFVLGLFLHANVRWRLRPLHRLIITPEFHHWHHANETDAHHTNYSTFLPLWDIVFGTYRMPADRRPQVYGVDEHLPATMAGQLWFPFRRVRPIRWALRNPHDALRAGWALLRSTLSDVRRSSSRRSAGTRRPVPSSPNPFRPERFRDR
ncbi:MAG: sterol desaturase family protein [Kineosporiaceae bacterium]|nr:sterol desaturase family protein [Kineosporiaceae bacterium]